METESQRGEAFIVIASAVFRSVHSMSVTNAGVRPDHPRSDAQDSFPQAVLFDLLTALLDSWTVWNAAAGSEPQGARGVEYLRRTYGCGAYLPYEQLVAEAAEAVGLPASAPAALEANWGCCRPGTARASCWRRCVRIAGWAWSPTAPGRWAWAWRTCWHQPGLRALPRRARAGTPIAGPGRGAAVAGAFRRLKACRAASAGRVGREDESGLYKMLRAAPARLHGSAGISRLIRR